MSDLEETGAAYLRLLNVITSAEKTLSLLLSDITDPWVKADVRNVVLRLREATE